MPIYKYACSDCKNEFEIMESRKILDDPKFKAECPKCKKTKCEKIIALTNFQLNGGDWAKTSYGLKPIGNVK